MIAWREPSKSEKRSGIVAVGETVWTVWCVRQKKDGTFWVEACGWGGARRDLPYNSFPSLEEARKWVESYVRPAQSPPIKL